MLSFGFSAKLSKNLLFQDESYGPNPEGPARPNRAEKIQDKLIVSRSVTIPKRIPKSGGNF